MIIKKTLFLFSFLFVSIPFFTHAQAVSKKLKCIDATSKHASGGPIGIASSTNYVLKLVSNASNKNLVIDRLWIGKEFFAVQASSQKITANPFEFTSGDTILVRASKLTLTPKKTSTASQKNYKKPFDYKGEALIGYKLYNKRKYLSIAKFEMLAPEIRQ